MGGQLSARPYSTAPTKNAIANLANVWKGDSPLQNPRRILYHDAALYNVYVKSISIMHSQF